MENAVTASNEPIIPKAGDPLWVDCKVGIPRDEVRVWLMDSRGKVGTGRAAWSAFTIVEGKVHPTSPQFDAWAIDAGPDLRASCGQPVRWAPMWTQEPQSISEILTYWASRGVMIELLAEGGGAWRVYRLNPDGSEHDGDGDGGCHWDPTYIMRVAHWDLRHRGLDHKNMLFPYPIADPTLRWWEEYEESKKSQEQ